MSYYVWNMETDEPELLGTYVGDDEGAICYLDASSGNLRYAPDDCVSVLRDGTHPSEV